LTDNIAARFVWSLTARARRIRASTSEVLVLNLYIHATAGRLSHHMETLALRSVDVSTTCSRTSHWRSMPVSSRSDIVSDPVLFEAEQNWFLIV
jgi:hypothetical protein